MLGTACGSIVVSSPPGTAYQEEQERRNNPRFKARRWVVERTNRWHNLFRTLKIRYEVHAEDYLGFVQFAKAIICWRSGAV